MIQWKKKKSYCINCNEIIINRDKSATMCLSCSRNKAKESKLINGIKWRKDNPDYMKNYHKENRK